MIVWNSINTVMSWGLREDDIAPLFTPQFHSGGLNVLMVPLIHIGGRIIVTREFNPGPALRLIERERATIVFMVPSMFRMIAEAPELATTDLGSVRFFLSGGAPCPADLMDLFRRYGKPFRQGFGMTEAGVNCFSMTDEESELKSGSVGKPVLHGSARLADESGRDVPRGEMGELLLRGPHIFSGYFGKDEDTARSFIDGWLRTEDLARIDGDGFFFIVGRKKDMIISGGENVYLAEVENVIALHPCVKEAAVIGVPDEKWGETGRALVVVSPGEPFSEEEIRAFCARHLARYKIPKTFLPVDALPRNPYGKLLRAELVRLYGAP
jgi:fatty-acyl-CoA synthase